MQFLQMISLISKHNALLLYGKLTSYAKMDSGVQFTTKETGSRLLNSQLDIM